MKIVNEVSIDLFPTFVKIVDFKIDRGLNRAVVSVARSRPEFNDACSDRNLLAEHFPWVATLRKKFDSALLMYLRELDPHRSSPVEVDAYMFLNYTTHGEFTPPHNHNGDADVVGIYYAQAPHVSERVGSYYYGMPEGMLVMHDSRPDCALDKRRPETADHYQIAPRVGRMVIHPASVTHFVSPIRGGHARVSVVCNFIIDRSSRRANYRTYALRTLAIG